MEAAKDGEATPEQIERAYRWAMKYANRRVPRPDEMREAAIDAATDAVLWALKKHNSATASFDTFCSNAVKAFVWRQISNVANRIKRRPDHERLSESIQAKPRPVASDLIDLPKDLFDVVDFFYVHGFTMRECAALLGCSPETIRVRLQAAGRLIAGGATKPARKAGEKRLER